MYGLTILKLLLKFFLTIEVKVLAFFLLIFKVTIYDNVFYKIAFHKAMGEKCIFVLLEYFLETLFFTITLAARLFLWKAAIKAEAG